MIREELAGVLRWVVAAVVVLFVPILVLIGLVGQFADGATIAERLLIGLLNPVAIVVAARVMLDETFMARHRKTAAGLAAIALIGNLIAALSIAQGWSSGDTEIPLIFSIPFVVFLPFVLRAIVDK